MILLAIDPGNVETGFVFYKYGKEYKYSDHHANRILGKGKIPNTSLMSIISKNASNIKAVYIEDIAQYGTGVGKTVFDTVKFIGMLMERCSSLGIPVSLVYRKTIVTHHTDNPKANDSILRQFLIDTLGGQGTKKAPGPLYGFAGDMFSALAIALYGADMENQREMEKQQC